ncbi:MAG: hypothetical protein Q7T37_00565 [bacterium]|nr:hypothetical protein [bacterium]MDO8741908.1 hypothetical protein [bacterium]
MGHLVFILTTLALLTGFFVLTVYETRRDLRFFGASRGRFDQKIARIEFIVEHVDFGAFFIEEAHRIAVRIGHDAAHLSLLIVRAAERLLTRVVRYFRSRHAVDATPRESARGYVKTLSDFKDRLKTTHPEISDI